MPKNQPLKFDTKPGKTTLATEVIDRRCIGGLLALAVARALDNRRIDPVDCAGMKTLIDQWAKIEVAP